MSDDKLKSGDEIIKPIIPELESKGFTPSGIERFNRGVDDFVSGVISKAEMVAESRRLSDSTAEITHEHVREGIRIVTGSLAKPKKQFWEILLEVFEYLFTFGAGVAVAMDNENIGTPLASALIGFTVLLIVIRLIRAGK